MSQYESSSCLACGYVSEITVDVCPDCGGKMRGASSIRSRGWWLMFFGLVLLIPVSIFIIQEAVGVYHSGKPGAKVRYTGGPGIIMLMFGFLGLIFSFGAAFFANGVWWVKYGKPNANLRALMLVLWSIFMFAAGAAAWWSSLR